jgi:hypothetical protein
MAQIVVAILLLAHGVGHALFLANSWGMWKGETARATVFGNILHVSQTLEGVVGILWLLPLIGFLATAWGYYSATPWWRTTALASSVISAALIILWWGGLNTSSGIFALVFDLAVVAILLYQQSTGTVGAAS